MFIAVQKCTAAAVEIGPSGLTVPGNTSLVLMDVPSENWLILTDCVLDCPSDHPSNYGWSLFERFAGTDELKFTTPNGEHALQSGAAVGAVFRPGSQVVVRNNRGEQRVLGFGSRLIGHYRR